MTPESCMLLAHAGATLAMVGLIWFVQVVHYPLFARVGAAEFTAYESAHQRRTTWVVAPLMLVEVFTAIGLIWLRPTGVSMMLVWTDVALLATIWLLTYMVQVPQHVTLSLGFDPRLQEQLVKGNWYRTIAWSARGSLVLAMLGQALANQLPS